MQGNYRHHNYLLAESASPTKQHQQPQHQHSNNNNNNTSSNSSSNHNSVRHSQATEAAGSIGLPTPRHSSSSSSSGGGHSRILAANYLPPAGHFKQQQSEFSADQHHQLAGAARHSTRERANNRANFIDHQQQQQQPLLFGHHLGRHRPSDCDCSHSQPAGAAFCACESNATSCDQKRTQNGRNHQPAADCGSPGQRRREQAEAADRPHNHHHHHEQQQQQPAHRLAPANATGYNDGNNYDEDAKQDFHYASQLRNSQLQYRFNQQQPLNQGMLRRCQQQEHDNSTGADGDNNSTPGPARRAKQADPSKQQQQHHVNFSRVSRGDTTNNGGGGQRHRSTRADGGEHEEDEAEAEAAEGSSRKKKYLTAKYGLQQMSLIKKRLKIEMWLHDQLRELTKGSKFEADLDEIDIDLDELLDMDDDSTRRRWLQKTLEPFEDVPASRISEFIEQVLEQSKLL